MHPREESVREFPFSDLTSVLSRMANAMREIDLKDFSEIIAYEKLGNQHIKVGNVAYEDSNFQNVLIATCIRNIGTSMQFGQYENLQSYLDTNTQSKTYEQLSTVIPVLQGFEQEILDVITTKDLKYYGTKLGLGTALFEYGTAALSKIPSFYAQTYKESDNQGFGNIGF